MGVTPVCAKRLPARSHKDNCSTLALMPLAKHWFLQDNSWVYLEVPHGG
jgi:hypothetical protein